MAGVSSRVLRVWAVVCSSSFLSLVSLDAGAGPEVFEETLDEPGIVAYPPRDLAVPRPVTVMLHGMCSEPERACRHFASTVNERGWLLCPRARQRCDGGGSTWSTQGFDADIEAGIERVRRNHPGGFDESQGRTLVGFSLGAFRALALAQAAHGEYPRVLLIGAKIYPDARLLRTAGVERILLASGDWDMMREHMRGRARLLGSQGFPVAFQSYGPVGHAFPPNFPDLLARALDWIDGDALVQGMRVEGGGALARDERASLSLVHD